MAESFWTVGQQVWILSFLIVLGFLAAKTGWITQPGAKTMANICLFLVTPCVLIEAFDREWDPALAAGFLAAAVFAVAAHLLGIVLAQGLLRDPDKARNSVFRFGAVFSNCGYMALPLQRAVLGEIGVFYGAAYIAVFNLFLWSYGLFSMGEGRRELSPKKLLLNPGVLGVAAGLLLFFGRVRLPSVLAAAVGHMAALNTPLAMLVTGYYLAGLRLREMLGSPRSWLVIAARLLLIPLISLGLWLLCGMRGPLLTACVLSAAAPVASASTMFAARFGRDTRLSANLVSLSTAVSLVTLPLVVGLTLWAS